MLLIYRKRNLIACKNLPLVMCLEIADASVCSEVDLSLSSLLHTISSGCLMLLADSFGQLEPDSWEQLQL